MKPTPELKTAAEIAVESTAPATEPFTLIDQERDYDAARTQLDHERVPGKNVADYMRERAVQRVIESGETPGDVINATLRAAIDEERAALEALEKVRAKRDLGIQLQAQWDALVSQYQALTQVVEIAANRVQQAKVGIEQRREWLNANIGQQYEADATIHNFAVGVANGEASIPHLEAAHRHTQRRLADTIRDMEAFVETNDLSRSLLPNRK